VYATTLYLQAFLEVPETDNQDSTILGVGVPDRSAGKDILEISSLGPQGIIVGGHGFPQYIEIIENQLIFAGFVC
jgi:hypothetical protein